MENRIVKITPLPTIDLNNVLSIEQRQRGFQLCEDDHIVTLVKNGTELAHWNSPHVTIKAIHDECDRYMGVDVVMELVASGSIAIQTKSINLSEHLTEKEAMDIYNDWMKQGGGRWIDLVAFAFEAGHTNGYTAAREGY